MQDEKNALIEAVTDTTTAVSKLKVRGPDHYSMFSLYYENGGQVPGSLDGAKWTSRLEAERAAEAYHRGK
jgi:hypothetical protein